MDQLGMARFVAGWRSRPSSSGPACTSCSSGCATCCPAATTWDQEAGLLDPNYQLAMLRFREEHMLGGVARGSSAASTRG
jgi:acyl-CoA oxidase